MSLELTDDTSMMANVRHKPLPEPMLTQIYVAILRHYATISCQNDNFFIKHLQDIANVELIRFSCA